MNFKKGPVLSIFLVFLLAGCASGPSSYTNKRTPAPKTATSRPYRITNSHMKNKLFTPKQFYEHYEEGYASYYGGRDVFHGRKTSTGEVFDKNKLMAAHRTLPLPSVVRVTNIDPSSKGFGRSIKVRVVDRGPFAHINKRIIDVSEKSAKLLGFHRNGTAKVRLETLVGESIRLAQGKGYTKDNRVMLAKGTQQRQRNITLAMKPAKALKLASLSLSNLKFLTKETPVPKISPFAHQTATQEVSPPEHLFAKAGERIRAFQAKTVPSLKPSTIEHLLQKGSAQEKDIPQPFMKPKAFTTGSSRPTIKKAVVKTATRSTRSQKTPPETFLLPDTETGIFVQAGSYTKLKKAQTLKKALQSNFETNRVRVSPLKAPQKTVYRVRLGPFNNSEQAEYLLAQLEQQGHDEAYIVYE